VQPAPEQASIEYRERSRRRITPQVNLPLT